MKISAPAVTSLRSIFILAICFHGLFTQAQDSAHFVIPAKKSCLDYPPALNKKRLIGVTVGGLGVYSGLMGGVGTAWYAHENLTRFQWFEDGGEWMQVDKGGHVFV